MKLDAALPFLGFDLSTPATLVVVKTSDDHLFHRILPGDNRAERLFPAIHETLEEAGVSPRDIRSLGAGRGPGAFTGVRNAVMAAKTFSRTLEIPLYTPTTLEILARGAVTGSLVVSLIDARRREVYCAVWAREKGNIVPLMPPEVISPGEVADRVESSLGGHGAEVILVGTGTEAYRELLAPLGTIMPDAQPQPRALWEACRRAMLAGEVEDPMKLLPLYLRKPDVGERRPGGARCSQPEEGT
jgi:tRNA threonylcarbamoyladenosine biosynthesis protein TsaB